MITVRMVGDEAVSMKLRGMSDKVRRSVTMAVNSLTLKLQALVKQKLSGEVLHVRTGNLRNSITAQLINSGVIIGGIVGTNCEYAAVHEFGFNGVVDVRAHMRRNAEQMKAAMYSYTNKNGERVTKFRMTGKYGKQSGTTEVSAHARHMNMPERSFLRSSLSDMQNEIKDTLMRAVNEGIQ